MSTSWEELAKKKRETVAELIPEKWRIPSNQLPNESERCVLSFAKTRNLLTDEEVTITDLGVEELVRKISDGEFTASQVCQAFCHQAAIAHQLVNCLVEIHFDEASKQAQELDAYYQQHGQTIGPLHGVPVSLKDQYRVKGLESSIGYVGRLRQFDEEESVMTECLRKAGAIIYVKTSVPQSLMIGETINNIFGRTLNPHNRLLSCGGSSGGEGALIALHGSPLGVGTDIGGSVRIPAAFNGLCGLKPSHGRLPLSNIAKSLEGQEAIQSICGTMAQSIRDLAYSTEAILQQQPWNHDPDVIDMPWREQRYMYGRTGKKTFGVIVVNGIFGFDGIVMPHPPVLRGIQLVIDALRKAGHTVVEWEPYKHQYGVDLWNRCLSGDGCATLRQNLELSDEPAVPSIQQILDSKPSTLDLRTLWKIQTEKSKYRRDYLGKWQQHPTVDAWIQPIAPHAAVKHDQYRYYGYATIINLLDWPAVTIPVTYANKEQDIKDSQYQSISNLDRIIYEEYDADSYHGAPVAIQLIARRLQEEYLLGLAEQIETALTN